MGGGGNLLKAAGAAALVLSMAYACTQPNALLGRELEKGKAAQPLNALTKPANAQTPPQAATDMVIPSIGIETVKACIVKCQSTFPSPEFLPDTKDPNVPTGTALSNPGTVRCFLVTITQTQIWALGLLSPTAFVRVSLHTAPTVTYPTGIINPVNLYNATNPILRPNSIDLPKPTNGVTSFYTKALVPNSGFLYLTLEYYDPTCYSWPIACRPYWGEVANPYVFKFKVEPC